MSNVNNGARGIFIDQKGVGPGILAISQGGNALWGITNSISSTALYGNNTYGEACVGTTRGGSGVGAVVGRNDSSGYGVRGFNTMDGIGVLGQAGISGGKGTAGRFENVNGANTALTFAVASNGLGQAAKFQVTNPGNTEDVITVVTNGSGDGVAVTTGGSNGVKSLSTSINGTGIQGEASTGPAAYGIWGRSTTGYAGYFSGNVHVTGTLSKAAGTFKIDHPLDPANKYLIHSFVESPDMMNIYNGNITTDANGIAVVQLPGYFSAENIDFKYQLTIVDADDFAQVRVAKKINNNQFTIKTDRPNVEVSWTVTGVRNDAYAKKHRVIPEVEKEKENKGKYLNPEENGKPATLAIDSEKIKATKKIEHTKDVIQTKMITNLASDMPLLNQ